MVLDKQFDAKHVVKTIEKICGVSEFVDPNSSDSAEMRQYMRRGKRRLALISNEFKKLGYRTITQKFKFRGQIATNALFARGEISEDTLLFTAHHDYIAGLGAEDNATALATMLELSRCLEEKESRIMFASFDLEELGLRGSRHFVTSLSEKQLRALSGVVALECLGSGKDMVICQEVVEAKSDPSLVSKLRDAARKSGNLVILERFNWFNSDHVPFAKRGVKTAEICSFNSKNYSGGPASNVNVAHSSLDVPENIHPSTLKVIGQVLLQFIEDFWI